MAFLEWQPVDLHSDTDEARFEGDPGDLVDAAGFLLALAGRPAWHAHAACRGHGPAAWFPGQGDLQHDLKHARSVCAGCPVRVECLDAGLEERHGLWGGTSSRQRRDLRRTAAA